MKHLIGILFLTTITLQGFAQNLRANKYQLPVFGNEIAFVQKDSVKNAMADNLYQYAKDWLSQTFAINRFSKNDKANGLLEAEVHFKIDDENIKMPLHYTALASIAFKDGVIRLNLHRLSYTTGEGKSEKGVNVTRKVKSEVRANADNLYPTKWNSLKKYGHQLLKNFNTSIQQKNTFAL